jgi:ParB family chromosome partitioning protein
MVVREKMSDADAIVINLNENLQRENLDIVQEAMAISRLRDLGLSEEMAAQELSKSRGWVQIRFMLLGLPSEIYPEVKAGFINQTNIRELFSIHRKEGKEATLQAAHGVKDKKQRGVKSSIAKSEGEEMRSKRHRKRPEIFQMHTGVRNGCEASGRPRCYLP